MSYHPHARVRCFVAKYGYHGKMVLDAFNEADPYHCFYGDDVNPDEYIGTATKYLETYNHDVLTGLNNCLSGDVDLQARERLSELLLEVEAWDPIAADRQEDE